MTRVFLVMGCLLVALAAGAQEDSRPGDFVRADVQPGDQVLGDVEPVPGWFDEPPYYNPFLYRLYERETLGRKRFVDHLDHEISRLEGLLEQTTPRATGRYGEVTARFGPQYSPYFWEQVDENVRKSGETPSPDTPEARRLLVEAAGRALLRHDAQVADRLLALYDLRAMKQMAERGIPPSMLAAQLGRDDEKIAEGLAAVAPAPGGSSVKVATFRNAAGHVIEKTTEPLVLDTITFWPDVPHNILLMVSLQATLERLGDQSSTVSVGLDIAIPKAETGIHDALAGPTLYLLKDDPALARKGASALCTGDAKPLYGGLHDQASYTFWLVAPDGAPDCTVRVSQIVLRVYYIAGPFEEAGTFE